MLICATGCDDDVGPPSGDDMTAAVDMTGQPGDMTQSGTDGGGTADMTMFNADAAASQVDLAGVDLAGGCGDVTCTPGPAGDTLCKIACANSASTCKGNGKCMP